MNFDQPPVVRVSRDPHADWDRSTWPFTIPAVDQVMTDGLDLPPGVTFLVGENGSGKSTLVEAVAIAYGLSPEGGRRTASTRPVRASRRCTRACGSSAASAPAGGGSSCEPRRCTAGTPTWMIIGPLVSPTITA
ncbi:AAA family ATPase [Aeromicrobium sp. UC242_57]|uniref:AAA family ATPase n=1 Tax=Aeromicrobium sp. UC242_57 TaxID=3374624 RepID=UPI003788FA08